MERGNTNWCQSVAAVCIRDEKVLLARHTYGSGKGLLIIPGGYLENGELPQDAVKREFIEEVNVKIEPTEIIGIRFNSRDWYVVFKAEYVSGDAMSDGDENNEVLWVDINEALNRDDVPDLTKKMIENAVKDSGFAEQQYIGKNPPYSLYGAK